MACSGSSATWSRQPAKKQSWRTTDGRRALLPSQMRGLLDAIESFQREDRVGELVGAAVQHRAGEGQEFLRHRLRVRKRSRLAGRIGVEPPIHGVVGVNSDAPAERRAAAEFKAGALHALHFFPPTLNLVSAPPFATLPPSPPLTHPPP